MGLFMFYTEPEAEHKFLSAIDPYGARSWRWIEFAIKIPVFLVSGDVNTEDGAIGRDWLFCRLEDVLQLINASKGTLTKIEIGLLSPGYMNGSGSYQLGMIKEVWQQRDGRSQLFVLVDGTKLRNSFDADTDAHQELELILRPQDYN